MSNVCIGCGACCMSYRIAFHWSETTAFPGGRVPVELVEPLRRHEVAMRGTLAPPLHCIALAGTPGIDAHCAIHGSHPACCQEVAVGHDQCTRARLRHGMAPVSPAEAALAYASDNPPAGHFPAADGATVHADGNPIQLPTDPAPIAATAFEQPTGDESQGTNPPH